MTSPTTPPPPPSVDTTGQAAKERTSLPQLSSKSQLFRIDGQTRTIQVTESTKAVSRVWSHAQRFGLVLVLVAMIAYFIILEPQAFTSPINIRALVETAAPILIVSVATTYILATGGIDLSIGSVVVLSGVVAQRFYQSVGGPDADGGMVLVGVGIALLTGMLCGLINGLMITRLNIPPLIATLGMMGAGLGIAQVITNGQDLTNVPDALLEVVRQRPLGIPLSVYIAVVITIIAGVFLKHSRFGLRILGIGSDEKMLRRRGVSVDAYKVRVYVIAGLLYGVVGILGLGRFSTTAISGHSGDALVAIAAVVIGGTSLFGGSATMTGTVIGVLIPTVLYGGLVIAGIPAYWQSVVTGVVLVVAVFFDQLQRRRRGA